MLRYAVLGRFYRFAFSQSLRSVLTTADKLTETATATNAVCLFDGPRRVLNATSITPTTGRHWIGR